MKYIYSEEIIFVMMIFSKQRQILLPYEIAMQASCIGGHLRFVSDHSLGLKSSMTMH